MARTKRYRSRFDDDNEEKKVIRKRKLADYNLMYCIEQIVKITEDSELSDKAIADCKSFTNYMSKKLGFTQMQCLLLSIFVNNYEDRSIKYSDIARHFDCETISIMSYTKDIDELVKNKYIVKVNESGVWYYKVPIKLIASFIENNPYEIQVKSNLSSDEFLDSLTEHFELYNDNVITLIELTDVVKQLIESNQQLSIAQKLKKQFSEAIDYELLIFMLMCVKLVSENDNEFLFREFDDFFESKRVSRNVERSFFNLSNDLFLKNLIQLSNKNEFMNKDTYMLTNFAKQEFLSEFNITQTNETAKNQISYKTITEKQLFYNTSEQKQINQLTQLLSQDKFATVQQKLTDNGMRKGFACLFYGAPGTGKTETVYQIAKQTNRDIISINVSNIKSKWVGDSEKNIKAVFDNYKKSLNKSKNAPILLFNEADAVLGIRKEGGSSAVDKMENSIQNIILQELEDLEGIMIATTNLTQNLDSAFERRFLYKIEYSKPNEKSKQQIWQSMMSELSAEQAKELSSRFNFSGGQIENIARKYTVASIINVEQPQFEDLIQYCNEENLDKSARRNKVGF